MLKNVRFMLKIVIGKLSRSISSHFGAIHS